MLWLGGGRYTLLSMNPKPRKKKIQFNKRDHRVLVLWAADCAERVLPYFEDKYPKDDRPRKAIEEGRAWAHGDAPMKMSVIRGASLAAHAAARATEDPSARAAARAAGQAVAAVHVATHAPGAVYYAIKAITARGIDPAGERTWQRQHLPKRLHPVGFPAKIKAGN